MSLLMPSFGVYSGDQRNELFHKRKSLNGVAYSVRGAFNSRPGNFLQPSWHEGKGGAANTLSDDGLVFVSSFVDGTTGLQLMRRNSTIVADWSVRFSDHVPETSHLAVPPDGDWKIDIHGALMIPAGDVVFNFERGGTLKLSRCGKATWTLAHPRHRSLSRALFDGYWILGRDYLNTGEGRHSPPSPKPATQIGSMTNPILRVSEERTIEDREPIFGIFYDSGLEALLIATAHSFYASENFDTELVHSSTVTAMPAEDSASLPMFEAGDLLLSVRLYNMLLVVAREDWRIRWHQTGPWNRQHDPEFLPDGTISVFDNKGYRLGCSTTDGQSRNSACSTQIMNVDTATGVTRVLFGGRPEERFVSLIRGKIAPQPDGSYMIVEIAEARADPVTYFDVTDWS
ncbi:arylsulfotransferase family protein [Alloyangia pacifica]|uniref:arylsulfotransferase family protein n=1 Tax=Alloyangia pacifica TaxID=311180 RepID=UPI001CD5B649|nr:arylsulfotransferase family protein [Alloyangia pacifica]MCA0998774.1 arylsulfotransferase family protein [Alloyangia pacifica]